MTAVGTRREFDLLDGEFWGRNPHEELAWLREHEPVYWDGSVWGITRHADVREVSLHPESFCSGHGARPDAAPLPMMIDKDGEEHRRRRKLVNRGFTPRRLADSRERISEICHRLIDDVFARGECDAVTELASWLPMHVIGDMLGFPMEHREILLRWSDDMVRILIGRPDPELAERATSAYQGFREFVTEAIAERRRHPRGDLLSLLIAGEGGVGDDPAQVEDVIHDSLLLLIGGDETTRHVLTGGLYQLLANPEQLALLRSRPELMPSAVEEMLRWVSPIKNMARTVVADTEFRGQQLRAGEKVILLYSSANRDSEVFAEPFRFDITRSPNDHLAFGVGTHFCLGSNLARLELTCFFEAVLDRFPDLRLVDPVEPAYRPANFISGYEHMPVMWGASEAGG